MLEKYEHGMTSYVTRTDVYDNKRHQISSDRRESVVVDRMMRGHVILPSPAALQLYQVISISRYMMFVDTAEQRTTTTGLVCLRISDRAGTEPSRSFYVLGEGPYYGLLLC